MLLKYLESCPLSICVPSQIHGTLLWNQTQLMAFGSYNTAYLWCASPLMLVSRNLFLCLHLEINSVCLFNNLFGSDLATIIFSVNTSHISLSHIYMGMHMLWCFTVNCNQRFLLSISISILITLDRLRACCV